MIFGYGLQVLRLRRSCGYAQHERFLPFHAPLPFALSVAERSRRVRP